MMFNLKGAFQLLIEKLTTWYELAIKNIPNLIVSVLVFITFIFLAKAFEKTVKKLLPKISKNRSVIDLLGTISYLAVLAIGVFTSLGILGLQKTVTSILAGAGVIGLALGFAFQEIASNFVSGVFIAFREPYQIGDIVEIDKFIGEVTNIELRTTSITSFQGLEVFVPNKDMFTKPFINYTSTPKRRVDIEVGVSYSDDLDKVEKVTKKALETVTGRIKSSDITVFFNEFGASSINLSARVWISYTSHASFLKARHEAIMKIKKTYDENGISIPFPIRTLDFGPGDAKELGAKLDA